MCGAAGRVDVIVSKVEEQVSSFVSSLRFTLFPVTRPVDLDVGERGTFCLLTKECGPAPMGPVPVFIFSTRPLQTVQMHYAKQHMTVMLENDTGSYNADLDVGHLQHRGFSRRRRKC